jgi:TolB-like protein/class 3 adenylate cyclase
MSQSRQLAAIMFTDIVGYTTLMGKDEQKAFEILKKNRQIQRPLIERHNGKWLKEMGDGILASFATVTDAVYCALEIQNRLKKEAGFLLRIGIHLGEVVFEKGDVFGDGVNIASRIQSIAPAGEIVVSESVCRNITNQKGLQVIFLSEETLKNVDAPIKIYRVKLESNTEAEADQFLRHTTNNNNDAFRGKRKLIGVLLVIAILLTAAIFLYSRISNNKKLSSEKLIPQAEKKSIAVLPFIDMSADKDQEYLGDGIAEEILNVLNNMMQDLKVTGRTSSFSFKGKGTDLKTIGKILNVKSILEGSVKKFGDKVRVTVNLINAEDESTIWSDQYDRQLKDIFSIQDEIAVKVGEKLKLTLFKDNVSSESRTVNPAAYEMVLKGNFYFNKGPEGIAEAVEFHKKAIAIDSTYAYPHIRLGWAIYQLTLYGVYPSKTGFAMARMICSFRIFHHIFFVKKNFLESTCGVHLCLIFKML